MAVQLLRQKNSSLRYDLGYLFRHSSELD